MWERFKRWLLPDRPLTWKKESPARSTGLAQQQEKLPPFSLEIAEQMRFDPQVRIAIGARNGLVLQSRVQITGRDNTIVNFVRSQWEEIWNGSAHHLLRAKLYGFLPFEVMYRPRESGCGIEFDRLEECHPRQVKLLTREGRLVGFSLEHGADVTAGLRTTDGGDGPESSAASWPPHPSVTPQVQQTQVLSPKALVCTFGAEFGNHYGCSLLERAYPAWQEKWMPGGAKKTLRLRMIKDAYIGDIFWYPPERRVELPDGRSVSWREIAKEIVEARTSGGAMTLPLVYDHQGRRLVDYTPPQDLGGATGLFDWKRDVDNEIWKALEMPPEVIEAAERGSGYSGRSIPLMVATAAVRNELAEIVHCVDRDILRPLVQLNFGSRGGYALRVQRESAPF